MQRTLSPTEERPTETQLHQDGITVHSWRVFREGSIDHFETLLTLWVGGHRMVAQLQLRVNTTFTLAVDGRTITLEAACDALGVACRENGDHLGPIRLIDNDVDGANDMA